MFMDKELKKYRKFTSADFALDDRFISSVLKPDEQANGFFKQLKDLYPHLEKCMNDARKIISSFEAPSEIINNEIKDRIWKKVMEETEGTPVIHIRSRRKYRWAAAAILFSVIASFSAYYILNRQDSTINEVSQVKNKPANDIAPGGNKAILTLADGSIIVLDSANNGTLSHQGNVTVIKMNDGKLAYDKGNAAGKIMYNTITTPRGGQYQLVLADGSKVWLNAESSLKFPVAFTGRERKVELTGEGYFEVAHDASKPFRVSVNDMTVEVLGTHFNVNAYGDENNVKATLLEGSVKVAEGGQSVMLQPGQQAKVSTEKISIVNNVNLESVVAWKEGLFYFDNDNIQKVMRQLERWYDIDVSYEGSIPAALFSGQMKRNLTLSQVMQILEYNNIKYSIVGRRMIISD